MVDSTNRFVQESSEADNTYYTRIDEYEDHPVIGPELRKMMARTVANFPPFKERAIKFGLKEDATIAELFTITMIGSAISGNDGVMKLVLERLDGRVVKIAGKPPIKNGNTTKNSLENLTDDQLQNMMSKDAEPDK